MKLWRGSLFPPGCEATLASLKSWGLLRSPAGASSLATGNHLCLGVIR